MSSLLRKVFNSDLAANVFDYLAENEKPIKLSDLREKMGTTEDKLNAALFGLGYYKLITDNRDNHKDPCSPVEICISEKGKNLYYSVKDIAFKLSSRD